MNELIYATQKNDTVYIAPSSGMSVEEKAAPFQIVSRTAQAPAPPKKQPNRLDPRWALALRVNFSVAFTVLLFVLLLSISHAFFHNNYAFVLLPTLLSMLTVGSRRYSFALILDSAPLYVLLSFCLALLYYGLIMVGVWITHLGESNPDPVILVAAALAWTVLLDPVRAYLQGRIERRFNTRNREARKAI